MKRLIVLMLWLLSCQTVFAQNLQKVITLEKQTITLGQLFEKIEVKEKISFSYAPSIIQPDREVRLDGQTKSLSNLLRQVLAGTGLEFLERGQVIILRKANLKTVPKKENGFFLLLQGTVVDAATQETLPFTTIRVAGTSLGFVTNEDGYFKIRLTGKYKSDTLIFSFVGFENNQVPIGSFGKAPYKVQLKESTQLLTSVEVNPIDPRELIQEGVGKIKDNYHSDPVYLNAYYREMVKVDSNFVKFADAACQIYYTGYESTDKELITGFSYSFSPVQTNSFPSSVNKRTRKKDNVKIIEARASDNYQEVRQRYGTLDFEQFDILGGPQSLLGVDYVKVLKDFLSPVKSQYYEFELEDPVSINEKPAYVVSFRPKSRRLNRSMFQGELFLDMDSKAIMAFDFQVSPSHRKALERKQGWSKFIGNVSKKERANFDGKKVFRHKMSDYNYRVKVTYQEYKGKWYLSTIKKVGFYKNSGNLIGDIYSEAITELIVNSIETGQVKPYEKNLQYRGFLYHYPTTYNPEFWQQYNAVVPTGAFGQALADLQKEKSLHQQFYENVNKDTTLTAPIAKKVARTRQIHSQLLQDDYAWLSNIDDPAVQDYIDKENNYSENHFIPLKKLRRTLYHEMVDRVEKNYQTLPVKIGDYYYYSRLVDSLEYAQVYRKQGSLTNSEELVVDINALAEERDYYEFSMGGLNAQHSILAYFENLTGGADDVLKFLTLSDTTEVADSLVQVDNMVWFLDGKSFLYTRKDPANRSHRVYLHELGTPQHTDQLVYEEADSTFSLSIGRSRSKDFLFINSISSSESEVRVLSSSKPNLQSRLVSKREPGHDYTIEHTADGFYMLSNKNAPNYQLWHAGDWQDGKPDWKIYIPHQPGTLITQMAFFENYVVVNEKRNARDQVRVINKQSGKSNYIKFKGDINSISLGTNTEVQTDTLKVIYSDPITPGITYAYNMKTRKKKVIDQRKIQSHFDPKKYRMERVEATARDGEKVPVTLIYSKSAPKKTVMKMGGNKYYRKRKLYLTAYGAYGIASEPGFSYSRFSLLDRGVIYAIAHVRGGSDKGSEWYLDGKMLNKKNTFTDFIDVADYLIGQDYIEKGNIVASGGSAGGLLMGVVANERPELFKGVILNVPFLDVINTMLDSSLPLTTGEYKEWGNPNDPEYFDYMRSYSPYDNIKSQAYPAMLFTAAMNDANVPYWEAVKAVAKLREYNTSENEILLKVSRQGGHGGGSGRFAAFSDAAFEYAFVLDLFRLFRN